MKYSVYKIYIIWLKNLYRTVIGNNNNETPIIRVILFTYLLFIIIVRSPKMIYYLWKGRKEINHMLQIKGISKVISLLLDIKKLFPNLDEKVAKRFSIGISYGLISHTLNDLLPKFQQISEKLSEKGWFLSNYFRIDIIKSPPEEIFSDEYNIDILRNNIDEIKHLVTSRFPKRAIFIEKAFKHHKSGDYISSIPIMIIQIDGIFRDLTQKELFSTNKSRKAASWLLEMETNGMMGLNHFILEPLKNEKYFGNNFENALKFPEIVSRNRILHGEDLHYYSELNSYKVISLLLYISSFVYDSIFRKSSGPNLDELYKALNLLKSKI